MNKSLESREITLFSPIRSLEKILTCSKYCLQSLVSHPCSIPSLVCSIIYHEERSKQVDTHSLEKHHPVCACRARDVAVRTIIWQCSLSLWTPVWSTSRTQSAHLFLGRPHFASAIDPVRICRLHHSWYRNKTRGGWAPRVPRSPLCTLIIDGNPIGRPSATRFIKDFIKQWLQSGISRQELGH